MIEYYSVSSVFFLAQAILPCNIRTVGYGSQNSTPVDDFTVGGAGDV